MSDMTSAEFNSFFTMFETDVQDMSVYEPNNSVMVHGLLFKIVIRPASQALYLDTNPPETFQMAINTLYTMCVNSGHANTMVKIDFSLANAIAIKGNKHESVRPVAYRFLQYLGSPQASLCG
jgi:hypothetical protein